MLFPVVWNESDLPLLKSLCCFFFMGIFIVGCSNSVLFLGLSYMNETHPGFWISQLLRKSRKLFASSFLPVPVIGATFAHGLKLRVCSQNLEIFEDREWHLEKWWKYVHPGQSPNKLHKRWSFEDDRFSSQLIVRWHSAHFFNHVCHTWWPEGAWQRAAGWTDRRRGDVFQEWRMKIVEGSWKPWLKNSLFSMRVWTMIREYGQQNWTLLYSMARSVLLWIWKCRETTQVLPFFCQRRGWKLHGSLPGDIFEEADAVTVSFSVRRR